MSQVGSILNQNGIYFLTFSIVQWLALLNSEKGKTAITDSLKFCIENKGLEIYAWVIMPDHVHLIASASEGYQLSAIIRDFKRHTGRRLFELSSADHPEKRSYHNWILSTSNKEGKNNKLFQVWRRGNGAIELESPDASDKVLDYIHLNPVKAGITWEPEYYKYSSAIDYNGGAGLLPLVFLA